MDEKDRKYAREYKRKQRENTEFKEKELERNRQWREENKKQIADQKKEYYTKNKQELSVKKKERHQERNKRKASWDKELTGFVMYEARKLCKIREKQTGIKWSVDHIIPLVGDNVSGLHVWNNLQVVPLELNRRKYNKHEEDSSRL